MCDTVSAEVIEPVVLCGNEINHFKKLLCIFHFLKFRENYCRKWKVTYYRRKHEHRIATNLIFSGPLFIYALAPLFKKRNHLFFQNGENALIKKGK